MNLMRTVNCICFCFQAEDGIRDYKVTGVQTLCSSDLQIGLKDAVLFLPGQQKLAVTASHQLTAQITHTLTLTGVFQPVVKLIAGQFSLTDLTLILRFIASSSGQLVLDVAHAPVTAQGHITWTGATALGLQNGLALTLGYNFQQAGTSGFTLALANVPVALPGGFAEISQGEIGIEIPADRPVF